MSNGSLYCTGTTTALYWYAMVYIGWYHVNPQRLQNVYGKVGYGVFKAATITTMTKMTKMTKMTIMTIMTKITKMTKMTKNDKNDKNDKKQQKRQK